MREKHTVAADLDEPLGDPREMLALLESQQRRVADAQRAPVVWLYAIWGVAWLAGFLVLWSGHPDGNPWLQLRMGVAASVFGVLLGISIVASAVIGVMINRGVRGVSSFSGAVYGMSWSVCGSAFAFLGVGLIHNGLTPELASLYFPSAYAIMCGTIYLGGSALWRDRSQLVLGLILLAVGAGAPFAGAPGNNLLCGLVGGGAFLVAAVVMGASLRRSR
jgi:hypothetical protein